MDHPFWRSQFLLQDPQDLARIRDTSIQEVWIDTSKGQDVAPSTHAITREQADAAIDTAFSHLAEMPTFQAPPEALQPSRRNAPTSMAEELARAAQIC